MYKKRYASPLWRITGSIVVALLAIVLGRELLRAPANDDSSNEAVVMVETATPTIAPQQGFPAVQGDATATLLPPVDDSGSANAQVNSAAVEGGQAQVNRANNNNGAASDGQLASSSANSSSAEEANIQSVSTVVPERSGLGWLPSFSFPGNLLSGVPGFSWLSTPVPTEVAVVATPTVQPTPTVYTTQTATPFQYIFPETAAIVEIVGNAHPCIQDWQMTDTWNKHAPGERIALTWRRTGPIPFDAEAKFQIGIALNEDGLKPFRAIPISDVVVNRNEILVDPLEAVWALNAIVNRNEVLNRPYVWGVFLVGASGSLVTRVSPSCYFQLDSALEGSLPNE